VISSVTAPPPEDLLLVRPHLSLQKVLGYFGPGLPDNVPFVTISGVRPEWDQARVAALKLQTVVRDSEAKSLFVRLGVTLRASRGDAFSEESNEAGRRRAAAPFELQVTLKQLQSRKLRDYRVVVLDLDGVALCEGPFSEVGGAEPT